MSATALRGHVLSKEELSTLIEKAKLWALMNGHLMRPKLEPGSLTAAEYAPMTLFPSPVPASVLSEACDLQMTFNSLMNDVAHDHVFLEKTLTNVIKVDSFMKMLWDIYTTVREEGFSQPISLCIFRNDYMMDMEDDSCHDNMMSPRVQLKQIENNTIASGMPGLSRTIGEVHRYTMHIAGVSFESDSWLLTHNCPAEVCARGFVESWKLYNRESSIIVFVVMEPERNTFDQKWMEKAIFDLEPDISVEYTTLSDAYDHTTLDEDNRLFLDGKEVAVLYFRAGYSVNCYPTVKEVDVRLRMERSRAIKCPPIHYHLAGCKKVQQQLAVPGVLETFIKEPEVRKRVRKTFAEQFPLDKGEEGDRAFALAMNNPERYVLKPQREGGGNNMYGDQMLKYLSCIEDSDERSAFILMERVYPWRQKNYLVTEGNDGKLTDVVSELGIFGVCIGTESQELLNEEAGVVMRTKSSQSTEGGLMTGLGVVDSLLVVSDT